VLSDVLVYLRCPVCDEALASLDGALVCANRHSFDIAREGYVNLLATHREPGTADGPAMMNARDAFLGRGLFAPIADGIAEALTAHLAPSVPGCIVEIGSGTGYYLARTLDAVPQRAGVALDISKHAAKRAARAHSRIGSVVCDAWKPLPVVDGSAAAVLDIFAPRNPAEIARILASAGVLVVVTPTPRHLAELVGALGLVSVDPEKERRLDEQLSERFEFLERRIVERELVLDRAAVRDLVAMGPSARHVTPEELETRIAQFPEPVRTALSVNVAAFTLR
jgi:23S rRNA (guanine745-N1)-methyltransferase